MKESAIGETNKVAARSDVSLRAETVVDLCDAPRSRTWIDDVQNVIFTPSCPVRGKLNCVGEIRPNWLDVMVVFGPP